MEYFRPRYPSLTLYLSLLAVLTALTVVATVWLSIPFPATSGYFNFGDALVMISGLLLGPVGGLVAGGVGSMIADLVVAPWYAPITVIVKGLEGMAVGIIGRPSRQESRASRRDLLAVIVASCIMLVGYLLGEVFVLNYGIGAALAELVAINSIQVIGGSFAALMVGPRVRSYLRDLMYQKGGPQELEYHSAEKPEK